MKYILNWPLLKIEQRIALYEGFLRNKGLPTTSVFTTLHTPLTNDPKEEVFCICEGVPVTFYQRVLLPLKTNTNLEDYM